NSTVSENGIQSRPITTITSGAKEQIGGGAEEKKMKEKTEVKGEKKEKKQQSVAGSTDSKPVDVSHLDVRKTPDADSLYVEEVDVGETAPRTVVSGLVNRVPRTDAKSDVHLRRLKSWHLLMGLLLETIVFDAFPGEPDKELNPKKKIWEQIQPDLFTNDECVATKELPLRQSWVLEAPTHQAHPDSSATSAPSPSRKRPSESLRGVEGGKNQRKGRVKSSKRVSLEKALIRARYEDGQTLPTWVMFPSPPPPPSKSSRRST
ncbi:hypothetical protein GH733_015404, partial [Mirounga leonina]